MHICGHRLVAKHMHMMPRHYLGLLMVVKATSRKSNFIHMEDVYTFKKNCGDEANSVDTKHL